MSLKPYYEEKPQFIEPRRGLVKAMARRAKTSHLGAFQILPEHVLLSCLAQLPREDHDAVADCSTGFRAIMRSERFLKARRAEDITEEALVAVTSDGGLLALVSGRVWRRLAPMPAEMRVDFNNTTVAMFGVAVIGSELFVAGDMRSDGTYGVAVHDAVDDSWFSMPLPPSCGRIFVFAVGCAGRIFVGVLDDGPVGAPMQERYGIRFWAWDADDQEWIDVPTMPLSMGYSHFDATLAAVAVGSEIFICERQAPTHFSVFDVETETWRRVDIPVNAWYDGEHSVSPFVDRDLLHIMHHRGGSTAHNDHWAYDTVNDSWVSITGGLPRHTASSESDRVRGIINHDGPDDFLYANETYSPGSVRTYYRRRGDGAVAGRRSDPGHDLLADVIDLPVRYDAVQRVVSLDMP